MTQSKQSDPKLGVPEPRAETDKREDIPPQRDPYHSLPITAIQTAVHQPRRYFDPQKLKELAESIKTHGVLEGLLVRPLASGNYELVAGERRLRAAIAVGLTEVPVTVRELTQEQALSLSLIENLQRVDLNPIEETEGIIALLALRLGLETDKVAPLLYQLQNEARGKTTHNIMGSSQCQQIESVFTEVGRFTWESFIVNRLPLLKLPPEILVLVRQGRLAYTKAQAISRIKDKGLQNRLLEETLAQNLSLGQLRQRIEQHTKITRPAAPVPSDLLGQTYQRIQASAAWSDPQKRERVKALLQELSALLS